MATFKLGVAGSGDKVFDLEVETKSKDVSEVKLVEKGHANRWYEQKLETPDKVLAVLKIEHAGNQNPVLFLTVNEGCDMATVIMDGHRYRLVED